MTMFVQNMVGKIVRLTAEITDAISGGFAGSHPESWSSSLYGLVDWVLHLEI